MATIARTGNVPDYQELEVYRGADFNLPFGLVDDVGVAIDITDYVITAQVRRTHLGAVVAEFDVTIEDALQGTFYITLTAAQTALLKCGEQPRDATSRYWWDVRVARSAAPDALVGYARHGELFVYAGTTRTE